MRSRWPIAALCAVLIAGLLLASNLQDLTSYVCRSPLALRAADSEIQTDAATDLATANYAAPQGQRETTTAPRTPEAATLPTARLPEPSVGPSKTSLETSAGAHSRDVMWQQPWRQREQDERQPAEVLPTVHYLWCGKQKFRIHHYLGLLSAIRVVHPTKIVVHYTDLPQTDDYNVWFDELKSSFMDLELQQIPESQCDSGSVLQSLLSFFSKHGGFFLGPGMVLARPPSFQATSKEWFATANNDPTRIIVAVKQGFNTSKLQAAIASSRSSTEAIRCATMKDFSNASACVTLEGLLYPRDFVTSPTEFAELARWLFYGRRERLEPMRDPTNPMPRIAHVIKIKPFGNPTAMYGGTDLSFTHFLSIISALYVGGFERVFFHAEETPTGRWWEELAKENVTLLPLDPPRRVFQKEIKVIHHVGDLVKYLVLNKYGGAYMDFDALWLSYTPDWLLEHQAVVSFEWANEHGPDFPEYFNVGVLMAQAGSAWLRHFIRSHQDFRDGAWAYNPCLMPYRYYEFYPDLVLPDRHLQVQCFNPRQIPPSICHPTWEENYMRSMHDTRPTLQIKDWKTEVRVLHITGPKPHPRLASPEALAEGTGFIAQVGRYILEKSHRLHLLKKQ